VAFFLWLVVNERHVFHLRQFPIIIILWLPWQTMAIRCEMRLNGIVMSTKTSLRNFLKPGAVGLASVRRSIAAVTIVLLTLLFLDFTGTVRLWFGWLPEVQLVPAILSRSLMVIIGLALLTLLFGRLYCSIICPLGILQDCVSNIAAKRRGKKNRFKYYTEKTWLRRSVLILFVIALIFKISFIASLLDPYAAFGRIASNIFAPIYRLGNNLLAFFAENIGSYAFYSTEVWMKSWITFGIAALTLVIVGFMAWRNGREYCGTICPVGMLLGFISKISIFRPIISSDKCTGCKVCESSCKASCIEADSKNIDYSRCVTCYNCIESCKAGAMNYVLMNTVKKRHNTAMGDTNKNIDNASAKQDGFTRRNALQIFGAMIVAETVKAPQLYVDGGMAKIEDKKIPTRHTPLVPPGARGIRNIKVHCTACQLCVSSCPNNVLRPSGKIATLMQPEMSFERGYCRPECVECSQVCPTSAINPISAADKTAISIGTAVWLKDNCIVNRDNVQCNNCEHHCPTGAITLMDIDPNDSKSLKTPVIDKGLCNGCGACEYLCPARPFSAIYVEGYSIHHSEADVLLSGRDWHGFGRGRHNKGDGRKRGSRTFVNTKELV
jgi:ferredoxin